MHVGCQRGPWARIVSLLAAVAVVGGSRSPEAALLFSDDFSYADGDLDGNG
jgi:hypothetical protein